MSNSKTNFEGEFLVQLDESSASCCLARTLLIGPSVSTAGTNKGFIAGRDTASQPRSKRLYETKFIKSFTIRETFTTRIQRGHSMCQDDCINVLSWPKCFEDSVSSHSTRRRRHNMHLGFINCTEVLRQRSCGTDADRKKKWSTEAAAIAAMLMSR